MNLDKTGAQINTAINEQYDGEQVVTVGYDDIQGAASNARKLDGSLIAVRAYNYGISGGVTFATNGYDVGDASYITAQTPHAMKLNSVLAQHFHYTVPTDGTGKKFKFQLDVIAAGVDGTWGKPASSPFTIETSMDGDFSTKHKLAEFGSVEAMNTTVSSIFKFKISRIAASADEYGSEVYMEFVDGHMQIDQERGSHEEYVK